MKPSAGAGRKFRKLVGIVKILREPGGCPWDRKQDLRSIVDYFLEEAYEAAEACLGGGGEAAAEELGDLHMEIVFLARILEEKGQISIADALDRINTKMISRHPHVFGGQKIEAAEKVVDEWQRRKLREKGRSSVLDGLVTNTPGLLAAFQIGQRASASGFDWPGARGALDKVKEEIRELEEAMAQGDRIPVAEEVGDLLFAAANLGRLLGVNPELEIRRANGKFSSRFRKLEARLAGEGLEMNRTSPEVLDKMWEEIKDQEDRPTGQVRPSSSDKPGRP
jgi:tetrapyrrole methylase family protein/MazG family protein